MVDSNVNVRHRISVKLNFLIFVCVGENLLSLRNVLTRELVACTLPSF